MSEGLKQKSLILYNIANEFRQNKQVKFPSGIVAHSNSQLVLLEDAEQDKKNTIEELWELLPISYLTLSDGSIEIDDLGKRKDWIKLIEKFEELLK